MCWLFSGEEALICSTGQFYYLNISTMTNFKLPGFIFKVRNSDSKPKVGWFLSFEQSLASTFTVPLFYLKHCCYLVIGSQTCMWIRITWQEVWEEGDICIL